MPQILYTIDEYISEHRKKETIWIVFNTLYNDVHAFNKSYDDMTGYLNKDYTDEGARAEFLTFMQTHFPEVKLVEVFDLVHSGWLQWPYLGSVAIDTDRGSAAYNALSEKYGNPFEEATVNNHVLWVMEFEEAQKFHEERSKLFDDEFGED